MYRVIVNSNLYNSGDKWLVVDMDGNTVSTHMDREHAEEKAFELTKRLKQERDAAIRLMEARREFLECTKLIGLEKVLSDGMIAEIIKICQEARFARK